MANKNDPPTVSEELDLKQVKKHLDLLDRRLDDIDSMVTAVAERIMSQPLTITITCPHCGKKMDITLIGSQKPR